QELAALDKRRHDEHLRWGGSEAHKAYVEFGKSEKEDKTFKACVALWKGLEATDTDLNPAKTGLARRIADILAAATKELGKHGGLALHKDEQDRKEHQAVEKARAELAALTSRVHKCEAELHTMLAKPAPDPHVAGQIPVYEKLVDEMQKQRR